MLALVREQLRTALSHYTVVIRITTTGYVNRELTLIFEMRTLARGIIKALFIRQNALCRL